MTYLSYIDYACMSKCHAILCASLWEGCVCSGPVHAALAVPAGCWLVLFDVPALAVHPAAPRPCPALRPCGAIHHVGTFLRASGRFMLQTSTTSLAPRPRNSFLPPSSPPPPPPLYPFSVPPLPFLSESSPSQRGCHILLRSSLFLSPSLSPVLLSLYNYHFRAYRYLHSFCLPHPDGHRRLLPSLRVGQSVHLKFTAANRGLKNHGN